MAIQNTKTRLAAAVGAWVLGVGLAAPAAAVVVVGGDSGWQVSFDRNVNAFYPLGDYDQGDGAQAADKTSLYGAGKRGRGIQAHSVDSGEVIANRSGPLGEMSFGRALLLFGRDAFLGAYDHAMSSGVSAYGAPGSGLGSLLDEYPSPRVEGEMSYSTAFTGGSFKAWIDALWQDTHSGCGGTSVSLGGMSAECGDISAQAWGVGTKIGYRGFELVGYFHDSEDWGLNGQFDRNAVWIDASGHIRERKGDGYYVRGTYAFSGKTKVGVSYGDGNLYAVDSTGVAANSIGTRLEGQLWTVGVYHDVGSWLRLIAEYNRGELNTHSAGKPPTGNTFSVGTFLYW